MSPNEVRDLLLWAPRSSENYQKIPKGAGSLWFSKPIKSNIEEARWGTYTRGTLIAFALLYFIIFESSNSAVIWALIVIAGYECAYTALRKEKNMIDNILADMAYSNNVDEFLRETYPGYKPPQE